MQAGPSLSLPNLTMGAGARPELSWDRPSNGHCRGGGLAGCDDDSRNVFVSKAGVCL